uniref:Uncharacterized protein n=1 Tax=Nelumbo nucifera TaxID=4432 RepID=A0A822Y0V2_NELNU|nr:TPA_asm: hypothetical protein HUJ06_026340 [Nelumbo nucifera]
MEKLEKIYLLPHSHMPRPISFLTPTCLVHSTGTRYSSSSSSSHASSSVWFRWAPVSQAATAKSCSSSSQEIKNVAAELLLPVIEGIRLPLLRAAAVVKREEEIETVNVAGSRMREEK